MKHPSEAEIADSTGPRDPGAALELVLRAFALAKAGGRSDWRTMTIAVLKNRLLDITDRQFDEADYGATNMREFVAMLDQLIEIDASHHPAVLSLRDAFDVDDFAAVAAAEPARKHGDWRIRRDLWNAVIDCVSGEVYVWEHDAAVRYSAQDVPSDGLWLPTIEPAELDGWRKHFADEASVLTDIERDQIDRWSRTGLSSQALPARYRSQWYGILKRHVRVRLEEWFSAHAVVPPNGWIETSELVRATDASRETEHLRATVIQAVRLMTRGELESLAIPSAVVARLRR